jgi:hypothetical protein
MNMASTLVASHTALPHEGAVLVWGGPALRTPVFAFFTVFNPLSAGAYASLDTAAQESPWHV